MLTIRNRSVVVRGPVMNGGGRGLRLEKATVHGRNSLRFAAPDELLN